MVPTSTRTSSTPQEKQTPAENSAASTPAAPKQSTVIHGVYFPGATKLIFEQQNEFNSVRGDMVVEEDESDSKTTTTQRAASPQRGYRPSSPSSYSSSSSSVPPGASSPISNPQWAPGTSISGQYFAGSAGLTFSGDNEFNSVKGTMMRTRRSKWHTAENDAGGNQDRIVDLSQKKQSNPGGSTNPSSPPPPPPPPPHTVPAMHCDGVHISGEFFTGASKGQFAGKNQFNTVGQNYYKTTYVDESQSIEGTFVSFALLLKYIVLSLPVAEELAELQIR
ncbi:hypothetical protein F5880DRAFT_1611881 [Lentinula raphanica]|nr:hypothetical protein F5880DRAFT_1611881 [Lentinula raphanica]